VSCCDARRSLRHTINITTTTVVSLAILTWRRSAERGIQTRLGRGRLTRLCVVPGIFELVWTLPLTKQYLTNVHINSINNRSCVFWLVIIFTLYKCALLHYLHIDTVPTRTTARPFWTFEITNTNLIFEHFYIYAFIFSKLKYYRYLLVITELLVIST